MADTVWHPVPGHEARLEVKSTGEIRSRERVVPSRYGSTRRIPARSLKPFLVRGYYAVQIRVAGRRKNVLVHRMIAELFVPNPEGKPHVNHVDGIKTNNAPANLEWVTHAENMQHAVRAGLCPPSIIGPGDRSPAAKLDWPAVRQIRRMLKGGQTHAIIADQFGVKKGAIGCIARNETWVEP